MPSDHLPTPPSPDDADNSNNNNADNNNDNAAALPLVLSPDLDARELLIQLRAGLAGAVENSRLFHTFLELNIHEQVELLFLVSVGHGEQIDLLAEELSAQVETDAAAGPDC